MIDKIQLLRNIGPFDSSNGGANVSFASLTLIYAENGRGKTMLSNVLRSLATGNADLINERHRLGVLNNPHIVIVSNSESSPIIFQNGAWTHTVYNIAVFDDTFVDENVYSGLEVEPEHRQNLHSLILGSQGVELNKRLQEYITKIEEHNKELRRKGSEIPATIHGILSIDDFCDLEADSEIDNKILDAERVLKSFQEKDKVLKTPNIDTIILPDINAHNLDKILKQDLPYLDTTAVNLVQNHLANLGVGGESWVADGMELVITDETCPFCAQKLDSSPVFTHYRSYFSEAYTELKRVLSTANEEFLLQHSGDASAKFERQIRVLNERLRFWSQFSEMPEISVDTESVDSDWRIARNFVESALRIKQGTPLDRCPLSKEARDAIARFKRHVRKVKALNRRLQKTVMSLYSC